MNITRADYEKQGNKVGKVEFTYCVKYYVSNPYHSSDCCTLYAKITVYENVVTETVYARYKDGKYTEFSENEQTEEIKEYRA